MSQYTSPFSYLTLLTLGALSSCSSVEGDNSDQAKYIASTGGTAADVNRPTPVGATGGSPASSGSGGAASAGGSFAAGGSPGSGGKGSAGNGSGGGNASGGAMTHGDERTDSDGCPITHQGFSTVDALGQDGTTGGNDGTIVTVNNQADLEMYAGAEEPYLIRVDGRIQVSPKGKELRIKSDKTIVGIGATGELFEGGVFIGEGQHNIIIRNLTIGDTFLEGDWDGKEQDWDGIQMDSAHHVWIDHVDLHHGGDGLIDSRKNTTFLTVSWSLMRDHNKAFGIGWTEDLTAEMTIHHNIIRNTHQRNPATDNVLRAHLFNNWLENVVSYGNHARGGTNMVLENSVFQNVNSPHFYDTGSLVAIGNVYEGTTGEHESSGSSYSFFNPADHYEYDLHAASEVKALLTKCAGPRPTLGQ